MKSKPDDPSVTRERVKRHLVQRFYTRFHMSLILLSSGLAAMLINWILLHGGVRVMWIRYPVAIGVAYLTFLAGIWLWLRYVGAGSRADLADGVDVAADAIDVTDVFSGGGRAGNSFGGGSTTQSFALRSPVSRGSDSSGIALGDFVDLDGETIVLLILALALVASIFLLSGYVIWLAPEILGEAAFGALLSGGLVKSAKRNDQEGWVAGVIRKTWWPFAIVLVLATGFGVFAAANFPDASTLRQAISIALGG